MRRSLSIIITACMSAAAVADVIVVDPAGHGDFLGLQEAIDAAAPNDVILIRGGHHYRPGDPNVHAGILVDKPLTLIGDPAYGTTLITTTLGTPALDVQIDGPNTELRIRHVEIRSWHPNIPGTGAMEGHVTRMILEDCVVTGSSGIPHQWVAQAGIKVRCQLILRHSTVLGGDGIYVKLGDYGLGSDGGHAIVGPGNIWAIDSTILGGDGASCIPGPAGGENGDGGWGVRSGALTFAGGDIRGGRGGITGGEIPDGKDGEPYPDTARELPLTLQLTGNGYLGSLLYVTLTDQPRNTGALLFWTFHLPINFPHGGTSAPFSWGGISSWGGTSSQGRADLSGTAHWRFGIPMDSVLLGAPLTFFAIGPAGPSNPDMTVISTSDRIVRRPSVPQQSL